MTTSKRLYLRKKVQSKIIKQLSNTDCQGNKYWKKKKIYKGYKKAYDLRKFFGMLLRMSKYEWI